VGRLRVLSMTYDLYLHEIEHGPAVVPGPLPPNAGETIPRTDEPKPPTEDEETDNDRTDP